MKITTLTLVATLGLAASSFGQGYVTVTGNQQSSTNTTLLTSAYTGGVQAGGTSGLLAPAASAGNFKLELLTATSFTSTALFGNSTLGGWLDTGIAGGGNSFAGRLTAGSGLQALNAAIGNSQSWLIVSWSANLGTWANVQSILTSGVSTADGFIGWSLVGTGAAAGAPPTPAFAITGTGNAIPTGWSLLAVTSAPEPGTIALAGLGGLSLLALRRKK
jgi:hypothetical protein